MTHRLLIVLTILSFFVPPAAFAGDAKPDAATSAGAPKRSVAEQETLAKELYGTMSKTDQWEIDTFVRLHNEVIEKCPDTKWAQESLWRLSNLYLTASSEPDHPKIILLMEKLIADYPDSPLVPDAKGRLLRSYEDTKNWKKAVPLYKEMFDKDPNIAERNDYAALLLGYADALAGSGETAEAEKKYRDVLGLENAEDWLKDIAKDGLENIGKK